MFTISSLDKKPFTKLMPAFDIPEDLVPLKYPSVLGESNKCLLLCQKMLRYPVDEITIAALCKEISGIREISEIDTKKIKSSKTIPPFIQKLRETRVAFDNVVKGSVVYDTVLEYNAKPDGQTATQLFKIKIEKDWKNFLFTAYSYAALEQNATELFLLLPLHGKVVNLMIENWPVKNRMKWRELLARVNDKKVELNEVLNDDIQFGMIIQKKYNIGMHVQKKPSLASTVEGLNDVQPFQIFLGNPSSSKLSIADTELTKAAGVMGKKRVYIHTPYIINLCKDGLRDETLVKNIEYAKTIGSKGVVVHVGKSTTKNLLEAIENMRKTIDDAITFATPECPLLLETPAGQGTETLTERDDFLRFAVSFGSPRLALCVDTCHVFTNGHEPLEYLKRAYETGLLRLVHFNDSASTCGACVDRHAYIGTGHMGPEKMATLAAFCSKIGVDMVVE